MSCKYFIKTQINIITNNVMHIFLPAAKSSHSFCITLKEVMDVCITQRLDKGSESFSGVFDSLGGYVAGGDSFYDTTVISNPTNFRNNHIVEA